MKYCPARAIKQRRSEGGTVGTRAVLRTLGTFELRVDGRAVARPSTQKARALLAYLALRAGGAIARDEIVEAFWPESEPENARQSLKTALWSIRRALRDAGVDPNDLLVSDNFTVRWSGDVDIDARSFEQRAVRGDVGALELYSGDFMPGDYDQWSAAQRERFIGYLESLLNRAVETQGDVGAAQRLLEIDPFNESAYGLLIQAEVDAGRRVAAQTVLQRYRDVLRQNGLHPSAAFESRFAELEFRAGTSAESPRFVGRSRELAAFEGRRRASAPAIFVAHADAGFGKTALLEEFKRRVLGEGRSILWFCASPERSFSGGFGGWEAVLRDRTGTDVGELAADRGSGLASALAGEIVRTVEPGSYAFVDDAHYLHGDAAFVTSAVARGARERGATVVVATRPEGLRTVLSWFDAGEPVELPLGGLSEADIRAVLPQRGSRGERLAHALFERTAGHPLFVARALERIGEGDAAIEMPESVRALIDERLRERGDDPYAVAGLLAIDPRFDSDELARILEWPEERVLDAIDDLLALGVVTESESAAHLRFSHDVVMEVARDALGVHRRKRLHRLAAALLTDAAKLADLERAGEHNARAGEPLAAAELFARCAEAARQAFEPRNAMAFARRALDELSHVDWTPQSESVWLQANAVLIRASIATADPIAAERIASDCIAAAEKRGDRAALFEMVLLRMRARIRRMALDDIESDGRWGLELAAHLQDSARAAEVYDGLIFAAEHRNDAAAAREYCLAALDAAQRCGDAELASFVAAETLRVFTHFRMIDEAVDAWHRGEAALHSAPGTAEPNFRYSVAQLLQALDRLDEAREQARRGLERLEAERSAARVSRFFPDRALTALLLTYQRGFIALAQARWDEAWACAAALAENVASNNPYVRVVLADFNVRLLLARGGDGDLVRAAELVDGIDPAAVADNNRNIFACMRVRVAVRRRDPAAPAMLAAALEGVRAVGSDLSDVEQLLGDLAEAASELGEEELAEQARALHAASRDRRRAAAGVHWGGLAGGSPAVV